MKRVTALLLTGTLVMMTALSVRGQDITRPAQPAPLTPQQMLAAARQRAVDQVLLSARSDNPFMRANAIEAAQNLPDRVQPLVQLALEDRATVVRFAALMTVGQLRLGHLLPSVEPHLTDPNNSVRMAAMFAMHQCGRTVDLSPLAEMVVSQDPVTRRNSVMILGMMGEPSAIGLIKDGMRKPLEKEHPVHYALARVMAAEAIAKLAAAQQGERYREEELEALHALRAGIWSNEDEVRVLSLLILARLGDRSQRPAVEGLLAEPPIEMQLAAAEYLARTGQPAGVDMVVATSRHNRPAIRAQAATTLGLIDQPNAVTTLIGMLDDSEELVRLAAATAILQKLGGRG